jgi:hypothetical protein
MATILNADTVVGGAVVTADASGVLTLQGAGNTGISISATGVPTLSDGNQIGFRGIPSAGAAKTTSYTLATTDRGEFVEVGASGAIVIPDATFSAGDAVVIFNNTSGAITITCSITTAYIGGTDADKATVSLATRGVCNILFISGTVCVITGNVT